MHVSYGRNYYQKIRMLIVLPTMYNRTMLQAWNNTEAIEDIGPLFSESPMYSAPSKVYHTLPNFPIVGLVIHTGPLAGQMTYNVINTRD